MTQTNNEREEYENFEAWLCTLNSFSPSELRFGFLAWQAAKQSPISQNEQQEPFGYFKAEPFGWTDCAETEEGAIPLYESPPKQAIPEDVIKDAARYNWLKQNYRGFEIFRHSTIPYMTLDREVDKAMLDAAPSNTEAGK